MDIKICQYGHYCFFWDFKSKRYFQWFFWLPYKRHYNLRLVYFSPTFWSPKTFFQWTFFQILALCMVSIQEHFLIKSGLWWHAYGISIFKVQMYKQRYIFSDLFSNCDMGGKSQKHGNMYRRLLWTVPENKNTGQAYVFLLNFASSRLLLLLLR